MTVEYLFNSNEWKKSLKNNNILLSLDLDGTLAPIVKNPDEICIPNDTITLIKELKKTTKIAIISGRDLNDLKKRICFPVDYLCGSHGLEIEGNGINFLHHKAVESKKYIDKLFFRIKKEFQGHNGIYIEKKKFSFTFHYRNVDKEERKYLIKRFHDIFLSIEQFPIKIQKGKMVIEILPSVDWNKGNAIILIMRHLKSFFPVYIGDDKTDEFAFLAIKDVGLAIKVGSSKKTHAKYFLKSQKEFLSFLKVLNEVLDA